MSVNIKLGVALRNSNILEKLPYDLLEINKQLAELLGWTKIFCTGNALLGTPPDGEPECRSQALVPDWTVDWKFCGPLMSTYRCFPGINPDYEFQIDVFACYGTSKTLVTIIDVRDFSDLDTATRVSICLGVIQKLKILNGPQAGVVSFRRGIGINKI